MSNEYLENMLRFTIAKVKTDSTKSEDMKEYLISNMESLQYKFTPQYNN